MVSERSVERFMSPKVVSVEPDCPVADLLNKMRGHRISCVLVSEDDRPIGLISERDIVGLAFSYAAGAENLPEVAQDMMSSSLTTIGLDATLDEAVELAAEHRIRHLPVVDASGRLAGLLTQTDLLRALLAERS